MLGMFQSRPLRLYYSVYDGPEVPLPYDDFAERFSRSRDPTWPTDRQSSANRLNPLPVAPDVKPTVGVDVKPPPPSLEGSAANNFRSRNQTGRGRKRRRRRSPDEAASTEKKIKQELTTDGHLYGNAGAPGHVTMTSPKLSVPAGPRGPQSGATLSLPVTISKDFIKELVVSRTLEKTGVEERRRSAADDLTVQHAANDTSARSSSQS